MKSTFLRMSLCTVLFFSSSLFASYEDSRQISQAIQKMENPPKTEGFFATCPLEILVSVIALSRFRDFEIWQLVSKKIRALIVENRHLIMERSKGRWMQISHWVNCMYGSPARSIGEASNTLATNAEEEREMILREFESLESAISLSNIEVFQFNFTTKYIKVDKAVILELVKYLKRMSLHKLEFEIWNADMNLDSNEIIKFIHAELPYLEQCSGRIEFASTPTL